MFCCIRHALGEIVLYGRASFKFLSRLSFSTTGSVALLHLQRGLGRRFRVGNFDAFEVEGGQDVVIVEVTLASGAFRFSRLR
jgi:hypothetical protein